MKNYFIFIVLIMGTFTGYILINRPGTLGLDQKGIIGSITSSLSSTGDIFKTEKRANATPPFFSYVSGDVLVNTKSDSFLGETNIRLKTNDEVFVSTSSLAVLKIGENQYIHFSEGSQAIIKGNPKPTSKGPKGFTEISLTHGTLLVDFFKNKNAVGVKVMTPQGQTISLDGTFRVEKKSDNSIRVAVDRGMVMVKNSLNKGEVALQPGEGVVVNNQSLAVNNYPWVDQFPWEKTIKETLLLGTGKRANFKAPPLSQRSSIESKRNLAQRPSRPRGGSVNYRKKESKPKKGSAKKDSSFVKKLGNAATNALKNIPSVGGKIHESTETVQNFEKLQKDRVKALDNLEQ